VAPPFRHPSLESTLKANSPQSSISLLLHPDTLPHPRLARRTIVYSTSEEGRVTSHHDLAATRRRVDYHGGILEEKRAIGLLHDVLIMDRNTRGQIDVDEPLRIGGVQEAWVHGQDQVALVVDCATEQARVAN
jgi:hypothetical protein